MKTLESCYQLDFSKINFLERKVKINNPKTVIYGPPKTGKSYLIYDYLSNFETNDYLYINLSDFRNKIDEIINFLKEFIKEKKEYKEVILQERINKSIELINNNYLIKMNLKSLFEEGMSEKITVSSDNEEVDQLALVIKMVEAGLGWALLPKTFAHSEFSHYDIEPIQSSEMEQGFKFGFALWCPHSKQISEVKSSVLSVIKENVERLLKRD